MYSLRTVSTLFSDKGLMDDRVAGIAEPVLMSLRQRLFKSTSKLWCIRKFAPKMGCSMSAIMNVQAYSRLRTTYNNLEGDNMGRVASVESCRVSVILPDARVATLLWPTSLQKTCKGLCTCVLYHRMFNDNSRQVH